MTLGTHVNQVKIDLCNLGPKWQILDHGKLRKYIAGGKRCVVYVAIQFDMLFQLP